MNFIAAFLLTKLEEEEAYWFFYTIMVSERFRVRGMFDRGARARTRGQGLPRWRAHDCSRRHRTPLAQGVPVSVPALPRVLPAQISRAL
jgi:hypothetical protein